MEKESYFEKINLLINPSVGLKSYLEYILQEQKFKRKKILKISDPHFSTILYVASGTLRLYYVDELAEEITLNFWFKGDFIPQMNSINDYYEQKLLIEFIETSVLINFPIKHHNNLLKLFPEYYSLESKISQSLISTRLKHSTLLATQKSKRRYDTLMNTNPALFNCCESKNIANYLGIHPKFLSLLRS